MGCKAGSVQGLALRRGIRPTSTSLTAVFVEDARYAYGYYQEHEHKARELNNDAGRLDIYTVFLS